MSIFKPVANLVFGLTVICSFVLDANAQGDPDLVTEIEGIAEYQLENGVQLLLFPDDSKPQVTVNMTVLVGSRHEGYGETGMAHLLEHLLFKGTPDHRDIPKLLKDRGVLNMNGTTWYDRTNYFETLPASDDNLEFMLKMESDRLLNSYISKDDLMSEMTVVRNEFEIGENNPQRILMQRMMATAYEWHNYGKSTIGNRSDIERVPIENLKAFYKWHYQPDNIMVVIAGQFDKAKALEYSQKYFGSLKNPERELSKTYTEEPPQDGEREVVLRRVGDVSLVGAAYHIPPAAHPDFAAVQVLSDVLGMEPSGRLYQKLVNSKKAAQTFTMDIAGHDPGLLLCGVQLAAGSDMDEVEKVLLETIESIGENGVSADEVQRSVEKRLKSHENLFANSSSLAVQLSEWRAYGDWRLFFLHRDRIEKVTAEQVQQVAKKYLVASNRTLGKFIPTGKPVRAKVPTVQSASEYVTNYKGRKKIASGEKFEPTPENIEARTQRGEFDGGIKYAMLSKKTRGEKVYINGSIHYGNEKVLTPLTTASGFLPQLLSRGTESLSYQELQDRLNKIRTTISFGGSDGNLTMTVNTRREFLDEAIQLLQDMLRNPALDEDEFEIVRTQMITQMESQLSEPQAKAFIKLQQLIMPYPEGNIRHIPELKDQIERFKNCKIEDIRKIHSEFLNGQHGEIAIVGDFDPESTRPKIEKVFDGWTSDEPYERVAIDAMDNTEGVRIKINTPDKKSAVFVAGIAQKLRDDDPEYIPVTIGNYILGGGPLSSRLADRVRKKEGLSYAVASMFTADDMDERGMLLMFAMSKPDVSEKVVATVGEEVQKLLESGVKGEELEKAKESYLKTRTGNRANDGTLASMLRNQLQTGRDMNFVAAQDELIASLTKDQVDEALRKMIDTDRLIIITAGDFEGVEKSEDENSDDEETSDKD